MSLKSSIAKLYASWVVGRAEKWKRNPMVYQERTLRNLINKAKETQFGKDHDFGEIQTLQDFQKKVPIRDYEGFKPYIERIKNGEKDISWPGLPLYLSKTSGTTSGIKYIPITQESIRYQIESARNALLFYIKETGHSEFLDGQLIFLSGSPELDHSGPIPTGRLSGIVNHHIPSFLRKNQSPTYSTNCTEDWEEKVEKIVEETLEKDMRLISGIPPWVLMYFDRLLAKKGKKIQDLFPNFRLFVYGGVNFEPYRKGLEDRIGKSIDSIETYPASEGFIAFQDQQNKEGLLLLVNSGIFYEFIPLKEIGKPDAPRLSLAEVKIQENYALVLSTNAGLWAYSIGDTIKFISLNPPRILVTGRIKHFISAFGEHVIAEEVESAIHETCEKYKIGLVEFTVAPQVNPMDSDLPYHEWFIEFQELLHDPEKFSLDLDKTMQGKNTYYKDLIQGRILRPLVIRVLKKNTFIRFMKEKGKLGGQNKVPHLSNDRIFVEDILKINSLV